MSTRARAPGVGRPQDPAKDEAILEAATRLIYGSGPQALSMDAVAREAGVSKPTLYRRYPNREALLAAAVERKAGELAQDFPLEPANTVDVEQTLRGFARRLLAFLLGPEHAMLMQSLSGIAELPAELTESIFRHGPQGTHERLSAWLARLHGRGLLRCADSDYSAELFMGMLMGLHMVRRIYRSQVDEDLDAAMRRADRVVEDFLHLHR